MVDSATSERLRPLVRLTSGVERPDGEAHAVGE